MPTPGLFSASTHKRQQKEARVNSLPHSCLTLALPVSLCLLSAIITHTYALAYFIFLSQMQFFSFSLSFCLRPSTPTVGCVSIEEEKKKRNWSRSFQQNQPIEHKGELHRGWLLLIVVIYAHFFLLMCSITKSSGDFRCCHLWT